MVEVNQIIPFFVFFKLFIKKIVKSFYYQLVIDKTKFDVLTNKIKKSLNIVIIKNLKPKLAFAINT